MMSFVCMCVCLFALRVRGGRGGCYFQQKRRESAQDTELFPPYVQCGEGGRRILEGRTSYFSSFVETKFSKDASADEWMSESNNNNNEHGCMQRFLVP